jgi:hypothetical protein
MRRLLALSLMLAFLVVSVFGCDGEKAPPGDGGQATPTEESAEPAVDEEVEDDFSEFEPSEGGTGSSGIGE